jgi:Fe-S cluster biogenesis protein NfuA
MAINIQLEWTPNPSTIKYVVDRQLLASGAANFTSPEAAKGKSPLAEKLMEVVGVTGVMIGTNFVTISKGDAGDWDELNDSVMKVLDEHLSAGRPVITAELRSASNQGETEIERKIRQILEDEIRPAVMNDGGDITLDHFEDGIVYMNMRGSCSGCPSSVLTLKMGIENRLREEIPEVNEVVPV